MLALDVDRTILTDDYRLLPQVRDAVQTARRSGVTVALATARGPAALEIVLAELGEVDHAICFGGALILRRERGAWAASSGPAAALATVDEEAGLTIASLCRSMGLSFAAYGRDTVYVEEMDRRLEKEFSHTGDRYKICRLPDVSERLFKFLVISRMDEVEKLASLEARIGAGLSCATSHVNYLEVGPPDVSKGSGLALLAQSIGIDRQHTAAIGDGENDLPMLAWAGLSIAMGNASQKVRDAAEWTTASNAEAGVAAAIDRLTKQIWSVPARNEALEENQ